MTMKNENSLSDEATFAGAAQRRPASDVSLGDERTLGDNRSGQDTVIDDIEVVDLEARYHVEGTLGQGGMGAVLLATDTRLDRRVAIKRILGEAAGNRMAVQRFLTEAKAIAALNHPNIVQIYDYGRAKDGPFLIMEYVDGGSLLDRCRESALPLDEAIDLACQLCDGLAKAHDLGIIHRDIKPANVLLTKDGTPKLTDFGLAKAEAGDHGQTMTGAVLGTPDFMPPEQRRDASLVDHRSDLWSLAATIYQMVTGRSPKVIALHELPQALRMVMAHALEDEKDGRYQSARQLRDALKTCLLSATPASAAGNAEAGQCPSCGEQNDSKRKFCRRCASALEAPCLGCNAPLPVWEEICGSCGAKQTAVIEQIQRATVARQAEAEGLLGDFEFERALDTAATLQQETHPRLPNLTSWVQTFTAKVEDSRAQQIARAVELLVEAAQHEAAHDYLSAIFAIESVPESLRVVHLPGTKEPVSNVLARLKGIQAEARRLDAAIKKNLQSKSFDGLLPVIENLIELEPQRQDLQRLRTQLLERREKLNKARDNAVEEARSQIALHDYQRAGAALAAVAPEAVDDEVRELREIALELTNKTITLGQQIQQAVAAKQFDGLLQKVEQYLRHKPSDQAVKKLRDSLVVREEKIKAEIEMRLEKSRDLRQHGRFSEALAILECIPESRSTEAVRQGLASCKSLARARASAIECLRQAQRGKFSTAVSQAEKYEQLLARHGIEDDEFAAALGKGRSDADVDRQLARVVRIYVPLAAALFALAIIVMGASWIRSSMRAQALEAALARQEWDAVLDSDPRNTTALIGRALQRLKATPPMVSLDDFRAAIAASQQDLAKAESISGSAAGLIAAKASFSIALAELALHEGRLRDAVPHMDDATKLGFAGDANSKLRAKLQQAWIDKAEKENASRSCSGIEECCDQAKRFGATDDQLNTLRAAAKLINAEEKLARGNYRDALTLLDAVTVLSPQDDLGRARATAIVGLANQILDSGDAKKAALLLKQAVDLGVGIGETRDLAEKVAAYYLKRVTTIAAPDDVEAAAAAYRIVKSDPFVKDKTGTLDDLVAKTLGDVVAAYRRFPNERSLALTTSAIAAFDASGLPAVEAESTRATFVEAMFAHAAALTESGELHLAVDVVSNAMKQALGPNVRNSGGEPHFQSQPLLVKKLLDLMATAGSAKDTQGIVRGLVSLGRLRLLDAERTTIRKALAAVPANAMDGLPITDLVSLPIDILALLPPVVIGKLPLESIQLLPDDVVDTLDAETLSRIVPPLPDFHCRLTGDSLGTSESHTDRRIALSRRHIASHKDGGNGSVLVWPLKAGFHLGEPREITSPHQAHDAASFGNCIFLAGDLLGVGSHMTWISAPHDGRFYLADIQTTRVISDFNPQAHTAQYFGHSAEFSSSGFFVVAEDGNTGHGTKAAFTFFTNSAVDAKGTPVLLLRDIIGANAPGASVSWCSVGCDGLVTAAPFRLANENEWILQTWRAATTVDGKIKSVARAGYAKGFPLMEGKDPRAGNQCKTNGKVVALSQPSAKGGRILLFDCSAGDKVKYLGSADAPENAGGEFGYSMAFAGNILCVGAPNAPTLSSAKGAVYFMDTRRYSGKTLWRRLTAEKPDASEKFGLEIAISDGLMAVSAGKNIVYLYGIPATRAGDARETSQHSEPIP